MKVRHGVWTWDGKPVGKRQLHITMDENDILGAMVMSLTRSHVPDTADITHITVEGRLIPGPTGDRVWEITLEADWYDR